MANMTEAQKSDYASLAMYLSAFEGTPGDRAFWESRFKIWWDGNPAFSQGCPRGWIIKIGGRICGFLGNIPSRMWVNGEIHTVYSITTWMVDQEVRDKSMGMLLEQLQIAEGTLLFDTTPTDHVAQVLRNLEFKDLPWGENKESFILLNSNQCLKACMPKFPGASLLAQIAGRLIGAISNARLKTHLKTKNVSSRRVQTVDESFNGLWEKTKAAYTATNLRTPENIRWHYHDDKIEKRIYTVTRGEDLSAYALLRLRIRRGLKTLECVDFWPPTIEQAAGFSLLKAIEEDARKEGFDLISFPHFSQALTRLYRDAGLMERSLPPRKNLVRASERLAEHIAKGRGYFTGVQGDYGTAL